jgi:hypothetical protein
MAPLRETADLYPPLPEDEDWNTYPKMGNIEKEMHYLHICPDKGLGRKNDPSLAARIPIPSGHVNYDCCFLLCLI